MTLPANASKAPSTARGLPPTWTLGGGAGDCVLTLSGAWSARAGNIPAFPPDGLTNVRGSRLSFRTDAVTTWDTGLIAFLWDLKKVACNSGVTLAIDTLPRPMQQLLQLLLDAPDDTVRPQKVRTPFVESVGAHTIASVTEVGVVAELGAQTARGAFLTMVGRSRMRVTDLLSNTADAGPYALLIVGVVNFLIGAILAFVGAVELQKFAAGIYVASLVGIAMVREMAAVMTAIIMAGRTGGAYAARISTMQGNEEIDALKVFGIPVSTYLILPAVLSLLITMPFLYLYGCLIGMLGGFVVAIAMLDITPAGYFHQTVTAFGIGQFIFGFSKSIVFGAFIGLTSCRIGLKAGRSAADVGIAATRAVVVGIVGVIAIDAIFAVIADVLGI